MTPDLINALFEAVGSIFTWMNVHRLWKQKQIRGTYYPTTFFFTAWGFWNLIYYPELNQWLSFAAGAVLASGNLTWCCMAILYRKN